MSNRNVLVVLAVIALVLSFLLPACQAAEPSPTPPAPNPIPQPPKPQWPWQEMIINGTTQGSSSEALNIAVATMISKYVGIKTTPEPTSGRIEGITNLMNRHFQISYISESDVYKAVNGENELKDKAFPINLLFSGGQGITHIVASESSGIKQVPDLKGKRWAAKRTGDTATERNRAALLEYYKMKDDDVKLLTYTGMGAWTMLKEGTADCIFISHAYPTPAAESALAVTKAKFLSLPEECVKWMVENRMPWYIFRTMPSGIYKGQDYPVSGIGWYSAFTVLPDFPEDLAYAVVKTIFENQEEFYGFHPHCKHYTLEGAVKTSWIAPYHPGVVKYFKEKGIWTSEMEVKNQNLTKKMDQLPLPPK